MARPTIRNRRLPRHWVEFFASLSRRVGEQRLPAALRRRITVGRTAPYARMVSGSGHIDHRWNTGRTVDAPAGVSAAGGAGCRCDSRAGSAQRLPGAIPGPPRAAQAARYHRAAPRHPAYRQAAGSAEPWSDPLATAGAALTRTPPAANDRHLE